MIRVHEVLRRLRLLAGRRRFEEELEDELCFHLEMETEAYVARGLSREEARAAAWRAFGGMARAKEDVRAVSGLATFDGLLQDMRQAFRSLSASRRFAVAAVLILALGIGASTAVFGLVHGVLLRPLPYAHGDRWVVIDRRGPGGNPTGLSEPEIEDVRSRARTLDRVVEYHAMSFILLGGERPERVRTGVVSADFFETLGVEAALGRTFEERDLHPQDEPVLVLAHEYWKRAFGGDPNVVGRRLEMNDRTHRVVGVLPPLPDVPGPNDVFMPVTACPFRMDPEFRSSRTARMMTAVGRMRPGIGIEDVVAELDDVLKGEIDALTFRERLTDRERPAVILLVATAAFVLLIACASVANLSLARLARREREMEMRAALGASGARLTRQLLAEGLMVSAAGAVLGVALAALAFDALAPLGGELATRASGISRETLLFASTLALLGTAGLGLAPAWALGAARLPVPRLGNALIVLQLAVSLALACGAGLMLKSLHRLGSVDTGFRSDRVVTLLLDLDWSRYGSDEAIRAYHQTLLDALEQVPEITHAAVARTFPLDASASPWPERLRTTASARELQVDVHAVSPRFFRVMDIPLLQGRELSSSDDERASRVALVNASAARVLWGGEDPIGSAVIDEDGFRHTVVGVVGDVRQYGLELEARPSVYVPIAQMPLRVARLVVRTTSSRSSLLPIIASAAQAIDPAQAIDRVQPLESVVRDRMAAPARASAVLTGFAGLAITVAGLGLAGSLALAVRRRDREIGVRLALGASPWRVSLDVLGEGMSLAAAGIALGLVLALGLSRLLAGFLFEIAPHDPPTLLAVSALLLVVTSAASFFPARLATKVDPLQILKSD